MTKYFFLILLSSLHVISQNENIEEISYDNPFLNYNSDETGQKFNWEKVDVSKLNWSLFELDDKTKYYSDIPFIVGEEIKLGLSFIFMGVLPKYVNSWTILNENKESIAKSFKKFKLGDEFYLVQRQEDLKEKVRKGKYYLRLYTNLDYYYPIYCKFHVSSMPKAQVEHILKQLMDAAVEESLKNKIQLNLEFFNIETTNKFTNLTFDDSTKSIGLRYELLIPNSIGFNSFYFTQDTIFNDFIFKETPIEPLVVDNEKYQKRNLRSVYVKSGTLIPKRKGTLKIESEIIKLKIEIPTNKKDPFGNQVYKSTTIEIESENNILQWN